MDAATPPTTKGDVGRLFEETHLLLTGERIADVVPSHARLHPATMDQYVGLVEMAGEISRWLMSQRVVSTTRLIIYTLIVTPTVVLMMMNPFAAESVMMMVASTLTTMDLVVSVCLAYRRLLYAKRLVHRIAVAMQGITYAVATGA
jgi:uncharacterized membrane protein